MNAFIIYKKLFDLFFRSFNILFIIFVGLMILEAFVAILTVLSIAPFADYMIDSSMTNPSKVTNYILKIFDILDLKPNLVLFGAIFIATNFIRSFLEVMIKYGSLKIKYLIIKKINIDLINVLMNSNWSYLKTISHGKLLNSIVRETGALGDSMGLIATQIANVFKLIIILALPTYLFPDFMIMNIGFCFLFFIPFFILQKIFYKLGKVTTSTANQTVSHLTEIIKNLKLIKGFVKNRFMSQRYEKSLNDHYNVALKSHTLSYAFSSFYQPLGILAIVTTVIFSNSILISDFSVIIWSLLQSLPLVGRILSANAIIINSYASYEQVSKIKYDAIHSREKISGVRVNNIKDIEFKNVSFSYNQNLILDKINIIIKKRKIIALVGISGSGKSTIIDLIMGFQSPSDGEIIINKKNITKLNLNSIRNKIGYVPQENALMRGTIKENLIFGEFKIEDIDIQKALDLADASAVFQEKIKYLNYEITDGGTNFSGGQKQKLALARAYLKKPDVYLFDETTSSLDKISETKFFKAIEKIKKNSSVLLITHNIKSLVNVDYIYFIENGKISCEGNYNDLKKSSVSFKKLLKQQSA